VPVTAIAWTALADDKRRIIARRSEAKKVFLRTFMKMLSA
jgi:hypothetical protein